MEQYMSLPANDIMLAYELDSSKRRREKLKRAYDVTAKAAKHGKNAVGFTWNKIVVPGAKGLYKGTKFLCEKTSDIIDSEIELKVNAEEYRTLRTQFEDFMTSRGYVNPNQATQSRTRNQPQPQPTPQPTQTPNRTQATQPETETNNAGEYWRAAENHRTQGNYRETARQAANAARENARTARRYAGRAARTVGRTARTVGSGLYRAGRGIKNYTAEKIDNRIQKKADAEKYKRILGERDRLDEAGVRVNPLDVYSMLYGIPNWARQRRNSTRQSQQPNRSTQAPNPTQTNTNRGNTRNRRDIVDMVLGADGTYTAQS